MISEYAKYMRGGYQIIDLMKLKKRDFLFWYRINERQIIEDSVISDFVKRNKPIPSSTRLKRIVDKKIDEIREGL